MIRKKRTALLSLSLLICGVAYGEHGPLLPKPQQVTYGRGTIQIDGMQILFSAAPSAEDRFAAEELRTAVHKRTDLVITAAPYGGAAGDRPSITLEREGAKDTPLAQPGEQPGPGSREAYDLSITEQGIRLHAHSSAGLYYGVETLSQLIEGEGPRARFPIVEVHDWPSIAYRGTMLDISHGPLPKESEIERQIAFLARWKANQFYLYTENSIELNGYPLLNTEARLTQHEVRRIVAYARDRHVDVIPNFDLYGHQHDLFRIEEYSSLADGPHGTEFDPRNPGVMPLLADWVNQFADLFPSPFVSIGFDETFQIEAATRTAGAGAAPTRFFVKMLGAVAGMFERRGKHVMAYDDIMVKYPQIIPELPPGLIAVAWYYTSEDPTYKRWLGPLVEHHVPHVVQPGVSSYDDIVPDFDTSFENVDTFLAAGRRSGAIGVINSVWADDAQVLFRMSLPGMAYGAAAPWQAVPMDRTHFFSEYSRVMYPEAVAPDIASALSHLAIAETDIKKLFGEQSMFTLWEDPFFPTYYKKLETHRADLHESRMHAEQAEMALLHAKSLGIDPETVNSLLIGSKLLDYAGQKFQTPLDMAAIWKKFNGTRPDAERWWNEWESQVTHYDHSYVTDLMDEITGLKPAYQSEWLEEYKPYRLGSALGRWDAEYQYWRAVHEKLRHFNEATHEGSRLLSLDDVVETPRPSWLPAN